MTLGQHQEAFSKDLTKLFLYIQSNGFDIRIGEVERTIYQQRAYMRQGKSKTMNSMHLKRCAIDLFIFKEGEWVTTKTELEEIGHYWENLSPKNQWGGNWKSFQDVPHFERHV